MLLQQRLKNVFEPYVDKEVDIVVIDSKRDQHDPHFCGRKFYDLSCNAGTGGCRGEKQKQ